MAAQTPRDIFDLLLAAFRNRDVEGAVGLYEADATLALQPGMLGKGTPSIRRFFELLFSMKPKMQFLTQHIIESGDLALVTSEWTIVGPKPPILSSTETHRDTLVLRKTTGWDLADRDRQSVGIRRGEVSRLAKIKDREAALSRASRSLDRFRKWSSEAARRPEQPE